MTTVRDNTPPMYRNTGSPRSKIENTSTVKLQKLVPEQKKSDEGALWHLCLLHAGSKMSSQKQVEYVTAPRVKYEQVYFPSCAKKKYLSSLRAPLKRARTFSMRKRDKKGKVSTMSSNWHKCIFTIVHERFRQNHHGSDLDHVGTTGCCADVVQIGDVQLTPPLCPSLRKAVDSYRYGRACGQRNGLRTRLFRSG